MAEKQWRWSGNNYVEVKSKSGSNPDWDPLKHPKSKVNGEFIDKDGSDTIPLPDDILMPDGGIGHFAEGTKMHHIQVFAGKGTKTPIRIVDFLVEKFGGNAEDWQKVKGIGTIDYKGEQDEAEVHWFQEKSVGKKLMKLSKWYKK